MNKLWLIPLLALVFACGPVSMPQEAESTVGITAPDGFSVSCITGYVRLVPHYCLNLNSGSFTLTSGGSCITLNTNSTFGIPTNATGADFLITGNLNGGNVLNQTDALTVQIYTDNTCIGGAQSGKYQINMRELVITNNLLLMSATGQVSVKIASSLMYYTFVIIGGAGSQATMNPIGYYD